MDPRPDVLGKAGLGLKYSAYADGRDETTVRAGASYSYDSTPAAEISRADQRVQAGLSVDF